MAADIFLPRNFRYFCFCFKIFWWQKSSNLSSPLWPQSLQISSKNMKRTWGETMVDVNVHRYFWLDPWFLGLISQSFSWPLHSRYHRGRQACFRGLRGLQLCHFIHFCPQIKRVSNNLLRQLSWWICVPSIRIDPLVAVLDWKVLHRRRSISELNTIMGRRRRNRWKSKYLLRSDRIFCKLDLICYPPLQYLIHNQICQIMVALSPATNRLNKNNKLDQDFKLILVMQLKVI